MDVGGDEVELGLPLLTFSTSRMIAWPFWAPRPVSTTSAPRLPTTIVTLGTSTTSKSGMT